MKVSFPLKGNSSKKRRLERQKRARRELQSLKNKNDQLQKRNEALRKRFEREKKKTSKRSKVDLTTLTPNSKTNTLLQEHGFRPSEFPVNLRKQLFYANAISLEIAVDNDNFNTAKKQVVRNLVTNMNILGRFEEVKVT